MTVRRSDAFPETGASASRWPALPEKYLDRERLTCAFVRAVLSGNRSYNERFVITAAPHHHRMRYLDGDRVLWADCTPGQVFDLTTEVRARVDAELDRRR